MMSPTTIQHLLLLLLVQQAFNGLLALSAEGGSGLKNDADDFRGLELDETNGGVSVNECSNGSTNGGSANSNCDGERSKTGYEFASSTSPNKPDQSAFRVDHLNDFDNDNFRAQNSNKWLALDQETTLRQVLIIHRHGDRTPINFAPKDKLATEPFWLFHGLGQLTNRGKARVNMLGKIVRSRYNKFLAGSVNKNNRKSRSSGALRCLESAQGFLSSFLSLGNMENSPDARALVWDKDDHNQLAHLWQPASITTLAAKYDGMLNEGAECQALNDVYTTLDNDPRSIQLLRDYKHEAQVLKEVLDFDIDHFYKWFWASSFLEVERSYFEKKVDSRLLEIYDRLEKAGDISLGIYHSPLKLRRLRAGLLINDMIKNMMDYRDLSDNPQKQIDATFIKKFVHYSAHDLNLAILLGMFNVWDKFPMRPDYASTIMIELHQDGKEWFVRLFYMPHVPMKPVELHIMECESAHSAGRCTLDKFDSLMAQYKVNDWSSWMKECGNSMDQVDPYKPNT